MPSDGKSSHCLWQGELKKTTISNNLVCTIWSGITLIRYASSQNIGKSNNLCLSLGVRKLKGLNRIAKIG